VQSFISTEADPAGSLRRAALDVLSPSAEARSHRDEPAGWAARHHVHSAVEAPGRTWAKRAPCVWRRPYRTPPLGGANPDETAALRNSAVSGLAPL